MLLGIDIGGHAIKAGLINKQKIEKTSSAAITGDETVSAFLDKVKSVIYPLKTKELKSIGIGVPGIVDPDNGIVYDIHNIPNLKEVALKKELESEFDIPVFINNDANCFALGENFFGHGKAYRNFLGITLGTGMGTGVIIDNKIYSGVFCGAGEMGMLPYKDGILENYTGSFFFEKHHTTGVQAYENALKNEADALAVFNLFGNHLGDAIHIILYAYAPQAIVLGGSISKAYPFFQAALHEKVNCFPFKKQLENFKIHVSDHPAMGILGAAAQGIEK